MIRYDMPAGEYHAHPARSKSYLWKLYSGTPGLRRVSASGNHQRDGPRHGGPHRRPGAATSSRRASSAARTTGAATSGRTPSKKAAAYGRLVLTSGDYDKALRMGDAARKLPIVRQLADAQLLFEASAFWTDPETGHRVPLPPGHLLPGLRDHGRPEDAPADASAFTWAKRAADMGYHAQEAWYTDGWQAAGGGSVDGFVFIAIESEFPHLAAAYELTPQAVDGGPPRHARRPSPRTRNAATPAVFPGYPEARAGTRPARLGVQGNDRKTTDRLLTTNRKDYL